MPIELLGVVKSFSTFPTICIEQFRIADGERIALVGKSGSGKSTLLNLIAGIVTPTSGSVSVDGIDIGKLSEAKRDQFRAANIGYVFQTFNLIQGLTALENVLLAMGFAGKHKSPETRAKELLSRVGLENKLRHKPRELSVGEQQRVAIARAVANEPKILLADEPTANLDEQNTDIVLNLLNELSSSEPRILILVTHERDVAARLPRSIDLKSINKI
ncbi:MAG: ABC transporter ATP-binding protein [[Candidatus Thermochlorobacteriaceae] bacterium GBChlB]|nr:MAG: ABC transporter ATP-binding protein [[Candidatus Thermochlorobacteriaceae] bacterium GBChlB]